MSLPIVLRPAALTDLRDIFLDLEQTRPGLGIRLLSEVRRTIARIEAMPEIYGVVWKNVRAARVRRFAYVLYFRVFTDRSVIIAIVHGARDPRCMATTRLNHPVSCHFNHVQEHACASADKSAVA